MTVSLGMTVGSSGKPSNLIKREWLSPFVSRDLANAINNPITFKMKQGGNALGLKLHLTLLD